MWCTQKLVCQIFWRLRATMSKLFPKANKDFFWDETGPPWQSHWNWPCRPLKWRILKVSMLFNARFWPLQRWWSKHPNPSNWTESPQLFEGKNMEKHLKPYHRPPPFCPENLVMRGSSCQGTTPRVTSSQQLNGLIHSKRMMDIASSAVLFRCWVVKLFPSWYGWKMKQEGVAKILNTHRSGGRHTIVFASLITSSKEQAPFCECLLKGMGSSRWSDPKSRKHKEMKDGYTPERSQLRTEPRWDLWRKTKRDHTIKHHNWDHNPSPPDIIQGGRAGTNFSWVNTWSVHQNGIRKERLINDTIMRVLTLSRPTLPINGNYSQIWWTPHDSVCFIDHIKQRASTFLRVPAQRHGVEQVVWSKIEKTQRDERWIHTWAITASHRAQMRSLKKDKKRPHHQTSQLRS